MVEAAKEHLPATTDRTSLERNQQRRIAWIGMTAASYAVDTLFLGLFAVAGTISGNIAIAYGVAAAVISAGTYAATVSGWNLKRRDPSLVVPLNILGISMQLGVVLAAAQIAFPFLANLFTVFAFGMIWLPLGASVLLWLLGIAGTAVVIYVEQGRLGIPSSTSIELLLVWLYFSLILGRCLLLSVTANAMRARLANSRRKLSALLDQVQRLASHDELTGTLNRRSLMAALEREHSRSERSGTSFSLAMIDLDHFKRVNDSYGHAIGDKVLCEFSATVRNAMRATDEFGRYGGEEFIVILLGDTPESAVTATERIRAAVAARDWSAITPDLPITLSAGIASHCPGETLEQLMHRADQALYQAKAAGRNTVVASPP